MPKPSEWGVCCFTGTRKLGVPADDSGKGVGLAEGPGACGLFTLELHTESCMQLMMQGSRKLSVLVHDDSGKGLSELLGSAEGAGGFWAPSLWYCYDLFCLGGIGIIEA